MYKEKILLLLLMYIEKGFYKENKNTHVNKLVIVDIY